MLEFVRRGCDTQQPIGELPLWLSAILRNRGVDTPEKAERFLHPSLTQLHDPFAMQGMEEAVALIRHAAAEKERIIIYGDYDTDGVCATSIMLETLRELGVRADFRIPSRHEEGYGLNEQAVREMAQTYQLLITVDCGVTNHQEVRLAQMLGMKVIVTDHHQLAETPSPADVVLNPLLGDYPFRRLCGAGVALKLTQALCGMEGVCRRIDLAALATVADIVPLIDENRVIVREGLMRMETSHRPGLRALMQLSGISGAVSAGHVGFRLAPRLNAGGRLTDAAQGVRLLTTSDEQTAQTIAQQLEQSNQQRQALEQDITQQAMKLMQTTVDFRDDLVIVVMGEGWNHGVIGLVAGRICERYHFPTIVLTRHEDVAVGSCRSIPGVNIHQMLSVCRDLFQRFGGHEQAAGLTMDAALVPELRRRLNLAIRENCDLSCYIPRREYDLAVPLSAVTLENIAVLEALQPTGYGNPSPVMLASGCHVQQARRVGKTGQHLKVSLLDGMTIRDGIAFSMGDMADEGMERVDVLFAPEKNEYMGRVTPQLQVQALRPAQGTVSLPEKETLFRGFLQEICALAEKDTKISPSPLLTSATLQKLLQDGRGVLVIGHERERAAAFALQNHCDVAVGVLRDQRGFNTLLMNPIPEQLQDLWRDVVLLDGDVLAGEAAMLMERCPRARMHALRPNPLLEAQMDSLALADEPLRVLYRLLRQGGVYDAGALAQASGLTLMQVLTGLIAFQQVKLVDFSLEPFALRLLPPVKCRMDDSPLIRYLRRRTQSSDTSPSM